MRRRLLVSKENSENKIPEANGYDYVDMGEAGIWATCNIGATKPEEYGLYFAWGETTGYANASAKPGGGFAWSTYELCKGSPSTMKKYCTSSSQGTVDNKTTLEPEDDAAHVIMGGNWRMPTAEEFKKLYDVCNVTWVTGYNGGNVNGRLFTLKTDSSKQLFFPAAGYAGASMLNVGTNGLYWSSSLSTSDSYNAYGLYFSSSGVNPRNYDNRDSGYSVRAILNNGGRR